MYRKIKILREQKGMSLQELSDATGIAKSTLQRYETGVTKKVPADAIEKIEKVFSVRLADGALDDEDKQDISRMLESCLAKLEYEQGALMFNGEALDDKTRDLLRVSLQNSITIAKMISKTK